jgi:hypothetical protein
VDRSAFFSCAAALQYYHSRRTQRLKASTAANPGDGKFEAAGRWTTAEMGRDRSFGAKCAKEDQPAPLQVRHIASALDIGTQIAATRDSQ